MRQSNEFYKQLLILNLSGICKYKNENEIFMSLEDIPSTLYYRYHIDGAGFDHFTAEFLDDGKFVIRSYMRDEREWLVWHDTYDGDYVHSVSFYSNGSKYREYTTENGSSIGSSITYNANEKVIHKAFFDDNRKFVSESVHGIIPLFFYFWFLTSFNHPHTTPQVLFIVEMGVMEKSKMWKVYTEICGTIYNVRKFIKSFIPGWRKHGNFDYY